MNRIIIGYKKSKKCLSDISNWNFRGLTMITKYNKRFIIRYFHPDLLMQYYYQNIIEQYTLHYVSRVLLLKRFHIWRIINTNETILLCFNCHNEKPTEYYSDEDECDWCLHTTHKWNVYTFREFSTNITKILNPKYLE